MESLEQISNLNLVNFFKEEFKRIDAGEPPSAVFTSSMRKRLLRKGILKREGAHSIILSKLTRDLLTQNVQ